jgi:DNA (cytosine-5)-methyltransferase 1
MTIHCIDLFCGIGGLTHGLQRGGVPVVAGVDVDPACRFPYEANNDATFVERSVRDLTGAELDQLYGDAEVRMLAGCAPCQPFSSYSRKARKVKDDPKWDLAADFARLVTETEPDVVTMENVPHLADHPVFTSFLESLEGFHIWYRVVQCTEYGVPQTRKRLVLLASRLGPIELIVREDAAQPATVRSAIGHLPPLQAGGRDPHDPLHASSNLSELNLRRIRASTPGGTWREWDGSLLASCHTRDSGQTFSSVYGRMHWDEPAPTITTQCYGFGNGRFGHPEQDRAISLREAAILQTFPEDYRFLAPGERPRFNMLGRLIGNAVPVRLGEVIAASVIAHLAHVNGEA